MKFSQYHFAEQIKQNLESLGYKKPTDIQYKCIPNILKGEDVLAIAQTGTGKTAAFALPVIHMLHTSRIKGRAEGIRCVVMEPTRELAIQINQVINTLARGTRVKSMSVFGGVEQDPQIARLAKGVDIIVATPGRLFDLAHQGHLGLRRVEILVLDEADHMLDLGFIKDIRDLTGLLPAKRQTLFFSATIDDRIKDLAYSLVKNPVRIQLSPKDPVSRNVDHSLLYVKMDDKRFFLERLVRENPESKILVFVRTKVRAERVQNAMQRVGIDTMVLHGDKEQSDRLEMLNAFRNAPSGVLIATDVSARGIDIPDVAYVVNYDLPEKPETYVHRVGRTGRGTRRGFAYSFCDESEKKYLTDIESYIGKALKVLQLDNTGYSEVIDLATEKTLQMEDVIAAVRNEMSNPKNKKSKKPRK